MRVLENLVYFKNGNVYVSSDVYKAFVFDHKQITFDDSDAVGDIGETIGVYEIVYSDASGIGLTGKGTFGRIVSLCIRNIDIKKPRETVQTEVVSTTIICNQEDISDDLDDEINYLKFLKNV